LIVSRWGARNDQSLSGNFNDLLAGLTQHYDKNGNPDPTYLYQQPGTDANSPPPQNVNQPYVVNWVNPSNPPRPAQSSDWWSNLMFRTDPTGNPLTSPFSSNNAPLVSEPAALEFVDTRWSAGPNDLYTGNETYQLGVGSLQPA